MMRSCSKQRQHRKLLKLIEMLEDHDDVNSVSANYDIDDALIEQIGAQ